MDITIRHVLVPVDFGPLSGKVLEYARAIALSLQAKVHLVHVLEEPFMTAGSHVLVLPDTPERRERLYEQARARLSRLAAGLRLQDMATTVEVRTGTASDGIVNAAIDYGADLIVMGRREHTDLYHLLAGGTADQVSGRVTCPVLTVRDHGGARMAAA